MIGNELCYLGLVDVGRRLRSRTVSSMEVTRSILDRIARLDGRLRSYATVTREEALRAAQKADEEIARGEWRGPLHGVPVAVKDLCRTRGVTTSAGMAIYKNFVPESDATVVSKLNEAGAVPLGKLQMTEGAFSAHHPSVDPPINPWDAEYWTGVSSSGSGVATAAGLCYGSISTDTLGSIRFPSTMNGVTGLKPTWGRVSRAGVFALAETLDHVGVMARNAVDTAAMLGAIAGSDPDDPTALLDPVPDYLEHIDDEIRGIRIGLDRELIAANADEQMRGVVEDAGDVLMQIGAQLRDIRLPPVDQAVRDAVQLCAVEAAFGHKATYPARRDEYGPVLAGLIEAGYKVDALSLAGIWQRRLAFKGRMATLFSEIDLLLMPGMNTAPPTLESLKDKVSDTEARHARLLFTTPFTTSGYPCLVLPGGATAAGLPLGFQIAGRPLEEALVLRCGHAYQQVTDWHTRRPNALT